MDDEALSWREDGGGASAAGGAGRRGYLPPVLAGIAMFIVIYVYVRRR